MNHDENATFVQTGPPVLRPQGASMIWKNFFIALFVLSVIGIAFCLINQWIGLMNRVSVHDFIIGAFQIIGFSMGFTGLDELNRCGYRKIRSNLFRSSLLSLALPLILLGVAALFKIKLNSVYIWYVISSSSFWILLITPFPLALYLNHKQNKHNNESNVADVS
jgi:hypothetical protein